MALPDQQAFFGEVFASRPTHLSRAPGRVQLRVGRAMKFNHVPDDREGWEGIALHLEGAVRRLAATRRADVAGTLQPSDALNCSGARLRR